MPEIRSGRLVRISNPIFTSVVFNDVINPWFQFCSLIVLLLLDEFKIAELHQLHVMVWVFSIGEALWE